MASVPSQGCTVISRKFSKDPILETGLIGASEKEQFTASDRLGELYGWMLPDSDNDNATPKLPEAKSVRDLSQIISDENALNILRTPEGTLSRALSRYELDHPEDWYPKVVAANFGC